MDKIIKIAIAGQGRSGWNIHASYLRTQTDFFEVVAIADELEERKIEGGEVLEAEYYSDYRELISRGGFDLFVNALPTSLHTSASIEALEAGFHVLCEKPVAINAGELDKMACVAEKNNRLLFPFQNNRLQ